MKVRFIKKPTKRHLEKVYTWCPSYEIERIKWHNRPEIGGALIMFVEQDAAAYLYYRKLTNTKVKVEFIEVSDKYKRQGVGTSFMNYTFKYFAEREYKLVMIDCVTTAGKNHALKLGFQEYVPEHFYKDWHQEEDCRMFYSIVPSVRLKEYKPSEKYVFAVWSESPSGNGTPDLYYDLTSDEKLPIIDYIHYDWFVAVMKGDVIIKQEKIKRFFKEKYEDIVYGGPVFITFEDIINNVKL